MRETSRFLTMVKLVLTVAGVAAVSWCSAAFGQIGTGPAIFSPSGMAVEDTGDLVVVDGSYGLNAVVRVDPVTGARTIVSDAVTGAGPEF